MRNLLIISLVMIVASCKREPLITYNADDSIYFNYRPAPTTIVDSMDFSFAYSDPNITDSLLALPLAVTGTFSERDRPVKLVVDPSSTAEEGKHYELQPVLFHAGKVADTFFIKIKRAEELTAGRKRLVLRLEANESFKTDIKYKIALTTARDTIDLLSFKIDISDILTEGPYWSVYTQFFGAFSPKKVRFINELLGMPLDFWLVPAVGDYQRGMAIYYAATTSRYLSEQAANGNPIYEEDGSLMEMGADYR